MDGEIVAELGDFSQGPWKCDGTASGKRCRDLVNTDEVRVWSARKTANATTGKQLKVKFSSGKLVIVTMFTRRKSATESHGWLGDRTAMNIFIKVPAAGSYEGLCNEDKDSYKASAFRSAVSSADTPFFTVDECPAAVTQAPLIDFDAEVAQLEQDCQYAADLKTMCQSADVDSDQDFF
jgi:hypothetical protein